MVVTILWLCNVSVVSVSSATRGAELYGSNSPKREFTLINAHKPTAETTPNGHKKCNLKSVKG